jgi:hypothetical protein
MRLYLFAVYVFLLIFIGISSPKNALSTQFVDETASRLPAVDVHFGWKAIFCDVDGDGDLDIYVAKEKTQSTNPADTDVLLINQGGIQGGTLGAFTDESATRLPLSATRIDSASVDCVDVDGDGDNDIIIGNNAFQSSLMGAPQHDVLLINKGGAQGGTKGTFADGSNQLSDPTTGITFDIRLIDINGDGDLDIFEANQAARGFGDSNIQINQRGCTRRHTGILC